MIPKIILTLNTIKFLKPIQIYYRLYYFIRNRLRKLFHIRYRYFKLSNSRTLRFKRSIPSYYCYKGQQQFEFLNLSKKFETTIDWNYAPFGKLWTYNLTYFDFLNQDCFDKHDGIRLMRDFVNQIEQIKDGLEPFPISLRAMNWIKFLSHHDIKDQTLDDSLYAQYQILSENIEYHLLGNHLLENGFALLFGAYYFQDNELFNQAQCILEQELQEQILSDGGHFELSPMYHQIMLFRVLDCINLIQNNQRQNYWIDLELLQLLIEKAELMLGWLREVTYCDGTIPMVNDSAAGIAPASYDLFAYAEQLEVEPKKVHLNASGYRKIKHANYEAFIDVGEVGASYLAGHAHADTFNFELKIDKKPFIVDTGTSTYQINQVRAFERSTAAHNCVVVQEESSSEVWGGFRVANRAKITHLEESLPYIKATHNGYRSHHTYHTRTFLFTESEVIISDLLTNQQEGVFYLHFHPSIEESSIRKSISFENHSYTIHEYKYALAFNKLIPAKYIKVPFKGHLVTRIKNEKN